MYRATCGGRLVPQQLLDGPWDQRLVIGCPTLIDARPNFSGPADQPRRGLVSSPGNDVDIQQQFIPAQPPRGSSFVLELHIEQFGHDVVGGILGAPIDVVGEDLAGVDPVLRDLHRLAGLGAHGFVRPIPDSLLVLLGNAEQHADHPASASARRNP